MTMCHGQANISCVDKIVTLIAEGSFNAEGVRKYANKLKTIVNDFNGEFFTMIIDHTQVEGGTPEAYEELEKINSWTNNNNNLIAKAYIIVSDINKDIMLNRTPSLSLQNIKYFQSYNEAKTWIKNFI